MSRGVKWRLAEERDREAIQAMQAEMERKLGRKMDWPDPLQEPVVGTVVGEINGVVVQGLFAEAELEVCACAPHALAASEMQEGVDMLAAIARQYKIRLVRCFVPHILLLKGTITRPSAMERMLRKIGFSREDQSQFAAFTRWML